MAIATLDTLIKAGVHFGHRVSRWNPKMEPFIYGNRNLIHIIDLRETIKGLLRAKHFLRQISAEGQEVIFVGTKRQAQEVVQRNAERCGMHSVTQRWLGGTLTNYATIRSRLKRLVEIETVEASQAYQSYSKKAVASLQREKRKIRRNLDGIRNMEKLPGAVIVVDPMREYIAVREANILDIPVAALMDTDCDPTQVEIPIPGNDDAYRSISIVLDALADAIIEGKSQFDERQRISERVAAEDYERRQAELARVEAESASVRAEETPAEYAAQSGSDGAGDKEVPA
ncbi:MAG: 30S ribosomal protein S2 [Planctomycetes bacterium]|nr:30S ribosomal protein S2 [Planctomycetota bacterium]